MKKRWRPWSDECPHCGSGEVEVLTHAVGEGTAFDGDQARCTHCKQTGYISVDGNDYPPTGNVEWHTEVKP